MTANGYALLVVDMQNGFCHPDGSFPRIGRGLENAMDAVGNAAVAVAQARRGGVPVVFTRHVYRPGRPDEGAALIRNSPELAGVSGLAGGSWDAEVCAELGCGPDDLVVDKVRFDAFQWTSLEPLLRGLGVTALMVCGVVTKSAWRPPRARRSCGTFRSRCSPTAARPRPAACTTCRSRC